MAHIYNSQLDAYSLYHIQAESDSVLIGQTGHKTSAALPALGHAIAGSTGTAISNLATYPLDLIITRLQVQRLQHPAKDCTDASHDHYEGIIDAAQKIYDREGIAGFFSGVLPDTAKSVADSFLFFLFYNYLRTRKVTSSKAHGHGSTLPAWDELTIGAAAGALSKLFTTPLSNISTRAQTSRGNVSVRDIASHIQEEKGIAGFWSGYSASLILTLNPSLTFFFYEMFKRLLPQSKRDDPGARLTFLMAALSKAAASSITYPFSLAKARAQASATPAVQQSRGEFKSEMKSDFDAARHSATAAREVGRKDLRKAADATVFSTILRIYREEGIESLYTGLGGEVLKGFFSHGITMLVKEQVHGWVIRLYYALQSAYSRFHPAQEAEKVQKQAVDAYERATEEAKKQASALGASAQNASNAVTTATQDAFSRATDAANKVVGNSPTSPAPSTPGKPDPVYDGRINLSGKTTGGESKSVAAGKSHSVYDQAVKSTKDQMSSSSSEPASPVGKRTFPKGSTENITVDKADIKDPNVASQQGDIGSTRKMESLREKKGAGN